MLAPLAGAAVLMTALAFAGGAQASVCRGQAPADAAEIRGPVLHVPDGDRICVALSPDPADWVELRVTEAGTESRPDVRRSALMAAAFGQDVTCRIEPDIAGEPLGVCRTAKGDVARLVETPRILRAGFAWR